MQGVTIVIPTYWGQSGDNLISDEKIVFDHPTPLDEYGTLGRLLESLKILHGIEYCKIVIIAVPNDPKITAVVKDRVDEIIAPYSSQYDIFLTDHKTLETIRWQLKGKGISRAAMDLLTLENYAAVRNICSLVGILNSSPYTIFIDDDEVFIDPDFLKKIEDNMDRSFKGETIRALAGYYLQPDTYRLDESKVPEWRAPYWNNTRYMNEAFDLIIKNKPRLKPTPFVFGGNMALALSVLKKVPFDPSITRGEDIDFLINLHINGITFWLDRELSIKHLPPGSSHPAWKKVKEDALRFLYERKKVMDHPVISLEELKPYPGVFLESDLEERIIKTNELLMREYESCGDEEGIAECKANITLAKNNPFQKVDTGTWLKEITARWQELTNLAEGMGIPKP